MMARCSDTIRRLAATRRALRARADLRHDHAVIWLRPRSEAKLRRLWDSSVGELRALAETHADFPLHQVGERFGARYYVCAAELDEWFASHNRRTAIVASAASSTQKANTAPAVFGDRRRRVRERE